MRKIKSKSQNLKENIDDVFLDSLLTISESEKKCSFKCERWTMVLRLRKKRTKNRRFFQIIHRILCNDLKFGNY